MSRRKTLSIINRLETQRKSLVSNVLAVQKMIRGSYHETYRWCGKPTCWCAKATKGHLYKRITWGENAQVKTKAIPENEIEWTKKVTSNYQQFRKNRKQIHMLDRNLNILLNQLENEITMKTKKLKAFLKKT